MPTLRTPLYGSFNERPYHTASGKDQFAKGCFVSTIKNPLTGRTTAYIDKRPGLEANTVIAAGSDARGIYRSPSTGIVYSAWFGTDTVIYSGAANRGVLVSGASPGSVTFTETTINGVTYILILVLTNSVTHAGTGWYLPSDTSTTTFTANRTAASVTLAAVSSFSGLYVGQLLSGTGIDPAARIASLNSGAGTLDMTIAASSGAGTATTVTHEGVAKIISPNFPTTLGSHFSELDGYVFVMDYTNSRIYNSDLNTVATWGASSYITCSNYSDIGITSLRYKNYIVAFSTNSIEFFFNAGNASGSPLASQPQLAVSASNYSPSTYPDVFTTIGGVLYWVGGDRNIYRMNGTIPEALFGYGLKLQPSYLSGFVCNNRNFLFICALHGSSVVSYMYCIDNNTITDANFPSTFQNTYVSGPVNSTMIVIAGNQTGKYYVFNNFAYSGGFDYTDAGASYAMSIQIQTDMGTNKRKFADELRIIADVQTSGAISVSYSDDDGATFSTARSMPVTSIAAMRLNRLGSWKGSRIWKFEDSGNNAQRIKILEIDYTEEK